MGLEQIRFVLVRPTHPGNIGAAARAMKTMALDQLWLVEPARFPSPEATALAAGAEDVLAAARVVTSLDSAIADCHQVFGTSARSRRIEWPTWEPRGAAEQLVQAAQQGPVAVLFGQERTGLTNSELDRCQALIQIPANPAYPSINLASAVQIMAYELRLASGAVAAYPTPAHPPATREDMRLFYAHLERVLIGLHFLDPANPRLLMRRMVRLFNRASPDRNDINILRGVLTAVEQGHKLDKGAGE